MRKAILVAMVATLALCGCGGNVIRRESDRGTVDVSGRFISDRSYDKLETIVDSETGVVYLVWVSGNRGGITPLLDKDGKVVISEEVSERR